MLGTCTPGCFALRSLNVLVEGLKSASFIAQTRSKWKDLVQEVGKLPMGEDQVQWILDCNAFYISNDAIAEIALDMSTFV